MYSYVVIIIPRGRQIQLMIRTRMDLKFVTMIVSILLVTLLLLESSKLQSFRLPALHVTGLPVVASKRL